MGARGPKPLPANVHMLRGNPSKLPFDRLTDELRPPVEIPSCPPHLDEVARAEWRRISKELAKLGLIAKIDRAALASYCTAWSDYVWSSKRIAELNADDPSGERGRIWDTPSGYKQMSVPLQIRNRALELMHRSLAEFGMSPSARARVTPGDPQLSLPGIDGESGAGWGSVSPPAA